MQAEYREKVKLVAEAYRLKIRSEISEIKSQKDGELQKVRSKNAFEFGRYAESVNM